MACFFSKKQYTAIAANALAMKLVNDRCLECSILRCNTQILIDKCKKTMTDSNGFFRIVMSKKKLPAYVEVLINGMLLKYKIAHCEDDDFSISTGYFSNRKINVISE